MASELLKLTVQIVTSHVGAKELSTMELLDEIKAVYCTLASLAEGKAAESEAPALPMVEKSETAATPAVAPEEAVQDDHVVCLECGVKLKTLKAHLRRAHNLTPAEYYRRFGLDPKKYPLVSRNYSAQRRELAMVKGLGEARRSKKAKA